MSDRWEEERRLSPRYALVRDFFLVFRPNFDRIGKLKDLSSGGAAFEYAAYESYEKVDEAEVDIFAPKPRGFLLSRVPIKIVYDVGVEQPSLNGVETRRCGFSFWQLSPQHTDQVELLLSYCAPHPLPAEYAARVLKGSHRDQ